MSGVCCMLIVVRCALGVAVCRVLIAAVACSLKFVVVYCLKCVVCCCVLFCFVVTVVVR